MSKLLLSVLCTAILTSSCAMRESATTASKRAEKLAFEKGRLTDITDPVDRTKSYIKVSQYLLDFVADSARLQDMQGLSQLTNEYVTAIQDARTTIVQSGRDPERRPQGYRELEISLRRQHRQLQDISRLLSFDDRKPIDNAIEVSDSIRQEVLRLLFSRPKS